MEEHDDGDVGVSSDQHDRSQRPRKLPKDLPTSINDRRAPRSYGGETEMYDGWQGQSQYLQAASATSPLAFNLSIADEEDQNGGFNASIDNSEARLMEMLAAKAAHHTDGPSFADEEAIVADAKMAPEEKRKILQKTLHMAASNGDIEHVQRLLDGSARPFLDLDAIDEEGAAPLIYASCFGHHDVVKALLEAGASVDRQDRNRWTALMWAMTNRHKGIAKLLLDHGASPEVKSSTGRTAFDFAAPDSDMSDYLVENGYRIGDAGVSGDDFYVSGGFSQDRFEQEMEETEMKRRMMMESSRNLEVDLSSLGMYEIPEAPEELENQPEFVWDRCLHDQMFVFQEDHLDQILDVIVTNMTPQRSPSQQPVPANVIFLAARYAYYHSTHELLTALLHRAKDRINEKVERAQWDMTVLAFWISNATLLLYYLRKDPGLLEMTGDFQSHLAELIHEIFILIIRDAERRMDRVLETAMLEHETIPGFEDVQFASDWNIFRSKGKVQAPEPISVRPNNGSKRRTLPAPRSITSLLSSTLFVLDLYDVHSVITSQILAQLFYWLGAELFNRILTKRRYLARTKAMQIRLNISALEDWALNNNRTPEHYEHGALNASGETTVEAARRFLGPAIQLLQWLQVLSSLGDDPAAPDTTLAQMTMLTPEQLLRAAAYYRCEVGERGLTKQHRKRLQAIQTEQRQQAQLLRKQREQDAQNPQPAPAVQTTTPLPTDASPSSHGPATPPRSSSKAPATPNAAANATPPQTPDRKSIAPASPLSARFSNGLGLRDDDDLDEGPLLLDPAHLIQFNLPTSVDLRLRYGGGYGGMDRERVRKYTPTVPPEILARLDPSSTGEQGIAQRAWEQAQAEEGM